MKPPHVSPIVRVAQMYTPPWPGHRLPSSTTAMPAGTRKVRMPRIHIGMAVHPPVAITEEPVIQQMMNT